eukprot:2507388-Rhodomonas_salina.1
MHKSARPQDLPAQRHAERSPESTAQHGKQANRPRQTAVVEHTKQRRRATRREEAETETETEAEADKDTHMRGARSEMGADEAERRVIDDQAR